MKNFVDVCQVFFLVATVASINYYIDGYSNAN